MTCSQCGSPRLAGAIYCFQCGNKFPEQEGGFVSSQPGRGNLILTLGLMSACLLGPFTGIPAWIMGYQDRARIRAGTIHQQALGPTTAGMFLGIYGTCLGVLVLSMIVLIVIAAIIRSPGS